MHDGCTRSTLLLGYLASPPVKLLTCIYYPSALGAVAVFLQPPLT